jgi:predicted ArsR family transcriptional regulator
MTATHLHRVDGQPLSDRVATISEIIDEQGGATEWERTPDGYLVRERNCPYQAVSQRDEHVCELDRQVMERLSGSGVHVTQRLRDGDESCIFMIAGEPAS